MLSFKDEFEYDVNGVTYYVSVEGNLTDSGTILDRVLIEDNDGVIDADHAAFEEINEYAHNREYEVEEHSVDFDYYTADFDNFLREKNEF